MALTVGVGTVLDAREVVVVVNGQRKALALRRGTDSTSSCGVVETDPIPAIEEGVNHLITLSALQMHSWALIVADEEATAGRSH